MRNIGVIFILVLIGMLIWKASDQEVPDYPSRLATAATSQESPLDAPIPLKIDQNPAELLAEELVHQDSEKVPLSSGNLADKDPNNESKAIKTNHKDQTRELNQETKEFERIVIPSLKVNAKVISKPYSELTWDLSNLEQNVAALDDIPNQTSANNIVLAGHVTVRNGSHGPFRYLWKLNPGDQVIIQDEKFVYTYIVRDQVLVYPEEISVLSDTLQPQLTLITCTNWDEETLSYLRRRVIFADLEKTETRQVLVD